MALFVRRAAQLLPRSFLARQLSTSVAARSSHAEEERFKDLWDPARFDTHFVNYFNRPDIDGWEVRRALDELHVCDVVPDPQVCVAVLRVSR